MNGTITIVLLWLVWMFWLDWVNPDELEEETEEEEEEVKKDIWNHPYLLQAGILKPIEECKLEDVNPLEAWSLVRNGKILRPEETVISEELIVLQATKND